MRAVSLLTWSRSLVSSHLRRNPVLLPPVFRSNGGSPPPPPFLLSSPFRALHDLPSAPQAQESSFPSTPSRILQSEPTQIAEPAEEDESMNEFLSRFVWAIRGKLAEAYPGVPRATLEGMLLAICERVVAEMDNPGGGEGAPLAELSEDLWKTIWEVSKSVHEAMRRDRMREELKKYLHCDEVKEMCHFANDIGIRGSMLRELRFKWAREKLEEVEFYQGLDVMREQAQELEEEEASGSAPAVDGFGVSVGEGGGGKPKVAALLQRRGKIKYKIYGLDLSDPEWAEVAERAAEAERHFVPEEPQPIEGKCKKVEESILALNARKEDPAPLLKEWADLLQPRRVDWLALLDRIKERNVELYFKVAEILLTEDSFETNIRDYSKLIDAYSKADQIEDAERILKQMTERGVMPDVVISIILVHMYSKAGNLERAQEAFESLRKEGFQPHLKEYNSMITAYAKAGLPTQGETLIREMEKRGIKPTMEMYIELQRAFAKDGQFAGAQRIKNSMEFDGIEPPLECYTLLIEACAQADEPDQARFYFDQMMNSGYKPDDRCTASMMAAYVKKNLLDKALDLLLTLEKDGFQPGIATYSVMVDWLGRLQLIEEVELLLSKIAEKGEAPFEIHVSLCDMYSRARQTEKAYKSLKILEARRKLLSGDQFERIVSGLLGGGLIADAKRIYSLMQAQGFAPSESIRVALMAAESVPRQRSPTKKRW